ncbi:hypothetical protein B484DRAFT_451941 [Ochromonadaceae sp. CCMP2298]|nr:hypothetical protein B484DRAFT_451941 [Ochromonadaceae sp. CCMP2298]
MASKSSTVWWWASWGELSRSRGEGGERCSRWELGGSQHCRRWAMWVQCSAASCVPCLCPFVCVCPCVCVCPNPTTPICTRRAQFTASSRSRRASPSPPSPPPPPPPPPPSCPPNPPLPPLPPLPSPPSLRMCVESIPSAPTRRILKSNCHSARAAVEGRWVRARCSSDCAVLGDQRGVGGGVDVGVDVGGGVDVDKLRRIPPSSFADTGTLSAPIAWA